MVMTLNSGMYQRTSDYIMEIILTNQASRILLFIIEIIFFGLSLVFLLSGVKSEKEKKSISKFNNVGELRISLNTIESIALAASRKLNGVKDTKAYVVKNGESVSILVKAVVLSEINIPALMEDIQIKVKRSVEETSGIIVNNVRVSVENIYTGYKSRVE
ncbi:MAG: alkaline shock response membrane anchor protein AmaP, partial [Clostridiaceae bacterium]|nr:alkaline shock response membrane anchor protein AmaP [Clostridiaceae bacterium]